MLKPGVGPMELLETNNEFLRKQGYPPEKRLLGHGQGYDLVERPSLQSGETMKIKAGMNIAVHPSVHTKKATAGICENYIVAETGMSECLHQTPKKIFVV